MDAVSYTHLDVYKRQMVTSEARNCIGCTQRDNNRVALLLSLYSSKSSFKCKCFAQFLLKNVQSILPLQAQNNSIGIATSPLIYCSLCPPPRTILQKTHPKCCDQIRIPSLKALTIPQYAETLNLPNQRYCNSNSSGVQKIMLYKH